MNGTTLTGARVEVIFWILLLGGLLVGIGLVSDWGRRWIWPVAAPEIIAAPLDTPQLAKPFVLPPPDAFIDITMRPLFVPTRRPAPAAPAQDAPKPSMKKGQYILAGTTIVGTIKFAHLIEKAGSKPHVVAEGKDINGILVRQVSPTRVVLAQHNETEVVVLQIAKPQSSAGTPPVTPRAPARPVPPQTGSRQ